MKTKRDQSIGIPVTQAEKDLILKAADKAGRYLTDYVRHTVLQASKEV